MFKVCISFLETMDEYGYPCEYYDFRTQDDALAFYALKKYDYKDDESVSVDLCF